jgi:hypothetical protein
MQTPPLNWLQTCSKKLGDVLSIDGSTEVEVQHGDIFLSLEIRLKPDLAAPYRHLFVIPATGWYYLLHFLPSYRQRSGQVTSDYEEKRSFLFKLDRFASLIAVEILYFLAPHRLYCRESFAKCGPRLVSFVQAPATLFFRNKCGFSWQVLWSRALGSIPGTR